MKSHRFSLLVIASFLITGLADKAWAERWAVSASGRHLVAPNGKPFFWLGDTAWLIMSMTDRREVETYLKARAKQGFTVIQPTLVMGEERVCGTKHPNRYGDTPFIDGDPSRPNVTPGNNPNDPVEYDYWDHVDFTIETAQKLGLQVAALPLFISHRGEGYKYLTEKNAAAYGKFLGERCRGKNLIWVLGGDQTATPGRSEEHTSELQ